jgi:hypothetical protein
VAELKMAEPPSKASQFFPVVGAEIESFDAHILNYLASQCEMANCLIKNLLEIDSLPQIRNLLEMREINPARLTLKSGVENEADDEGTETAGGGDCGTISQGQQEGEGCNSE